MSLVQPATYTWAKEDAIATRTGKKGREKGKARDGATEEPRDPEMPPGVHCRQQALFRVEVTRQREKGWDHRGACLHARVVSVPSDSYYAWCNMHRHCVCAHACRTQCLPAEVSYTAHVCVRACMALSFSPGLICKLCDVCVHFTGDYALSFA